MDDRFNEIYTVFGTKTFTFTLMFTFTNYEVIYMATHVHVPSDIFEVHPRSYVLEVEGDCMLDTVPNGSLVAVDPDLQPAANGSDIAVVRVGAGQYLCRVMRLMGKIVLLHDNPKYRTVTLPEQQVTIVGTVVWVSSPISASNMVM